jgi:hypothetical protein
VDNGTVHSLNNGRESLEGIFLFYLLFLYLFLCCFVMFLFYFAFCVLYLADFPSPSPLYADILILHLENGKDYFVTVSGKFLVSSFGNTLDFLVRTPNPVRASSPLFPNLTLSPSPASRAGSTAQQPPASTIDTEQRLSVPKELWRLVDYIYKKGMLEVR